MNPIERVRVRARTDGAERDGVDLVAVEEPLEIRVREDGGAPIVFVTTMRTPGADLELAAGLLFAEGVLAAREDLLSLDRPSDPRVESELRANVVVATLGVAAHERARALVRGTVMGSACGVCGKTSIERVVAPDAKPLAGGLCVSPETLFALPERLRASQSVFAETGGLHAAALFDASGALRAVREDIGRHNATDKIVGGEWLADRLPLESALLFVSGRAGFEIVQKAFGAGITLVASVSAASSLAVELAESAGITLVGFLRERRYNVYTHPGRVTRS